MTVTLRRPVVAGGVMHPAGTRWRLDRSMRATVRLSSARGVVYVRRVDVRPARVA